MNLWQYGAISQRILDSFPLLLRLYTRNLWQNDAIPPDSSVVLWSIIKAKNCANCYRLIPFSWTILLSHPMLLGEYTMQPVIFSQTISYFTLSYLGSLQSNMCKMLQFSQTILYPHSLVLRYYAEQSLGQNNSIHILSFWNSIQRNLLQYVTFSKRISYSFISPRQYTEQPVAEWCTSPENIIFLPCFTKVECKSTFGSVVSLSKRIPNSHSGLLRHHAQQLLTRLCCSPR